MLLSTLLVLLLASCQATQRAASSTNRLQGQEPPPKADIVPVLSSGDYLSVKVGEPPRGILVYAPVDGDGDVWLPLVGRIHIGGLDSVSAEILIAQLYAERGIYQAPSVTIDLLGRNVVLVDGLVRRPGIYPWTADLSIAELLDSVGIEPGASRVTLGLRGARVTFPLFLRPDKQLEVPLEGNSRISVW